MGKVRANAFVSANDSNTAAFNGVTVGSFNFKEVTVAQTQTTFSNVALAVFNNLTTTGRYEIGCSFEVDSKAAAANNNIKVDLRALTTTGTQIGSLWGAYAGTNSAGFIASGFTEITGISGTVKVRLNTDGSTQTNPSNLTTTASYIYIKEIPMHITTTAFD